MKKVLKAKVARMKIPTHIPSWKLLESIKYAVSLNCHTIRKFQNIPGKTHISSDPLVLFHWQVLQK